MYMANSSGMKKYICSSSGAGSFAPVLKNYFKFRRRSRDAEVI